MSLWAYSCPQPHLERLLAVLVGWASEYLPKCTVIQGPTCGIQTETMTWS